MTFGEIDEDVTVDFQALRKGEDRVAIVATLPLTDNEIWSLIFPSQLLVFQNGTLILPSK